MDRKRGGRGPGRSTGRDEEYIHPAALTVKYEEGAKNKKPYGGKEEERDRAVHTNCDERFGTERD